MIINESVELVGVESLKPHPANPRQGDVGAIYESIKANGFYGALVVQKSTNYVIAGNHRLKAAREAGIEAVPVAYVDVDDERAMRILLADNRTNDLASYDDSALAELLEHLATTDDGLTGTGYDGDSLDDLLKDLDRDRPEPVDLVERWGAPPFSVLDSKQGYWQSRRREWNEIIGEDQLAGRGPGLLSKGSKTIAYHSDYAESAEDGFTSVFDPVLAELVYRWFLPPGGLCVDPFAGGVARGAVAAKTGRRYHGVDISEKQIEANKQTGFEADWVCADSAVYSFPESDLVFSCPPYFDLETYTDDPADISNAGNYARFAEMYGRILANAVGTLADNRFVVLVVASIRDKDFYHPFVRDTIRLTEAAGAGFYNNAVYLQPIHSASLRATRIFSAARKLTPVHQNVLVFCKGDPKLATEAVGDSALDSVN